MVSCVECGNSAEEDHHVVPKSCGGTFTVPLCSVCHGKAHGLIGREGHTELSKRGLDRKVKEELAAVYFSVFVDGLSVKEAGILHHITMPKMLRRVKRLQCMAAEWKLDLFSQIVGDVVTLSTYKYYDKLFKATE